MYPKNATTPPTIAIGAVIQISDGAVQSSGVSVVVRPEGGTETAGGGTVSYGGSSNVVYYAPTQADTNYTAFTVTAYKAGCIPVSQTIVTTASSTSGNVILAGVTHTSAVIPTVSTLTGHTAQTGDCYARLGAPAGASVSADVAAVKSDSAAILVDTGTDGVVLIEKERQSCESGQAQAGAVGSITLRAAAPTTNNLYVGQKITIYSGTGCGQTRGISNYNGSTKVATVARNWEVAPDANSYYRVEFDFGPKVDNALEVTVSTNNDKTGYALSATGADAIGTASTFTQAVVDGVWNEAIAGHLSAGSTGLALNSAGSAGDPWSTAVPGAYGAGSAGYILGNNLDAAISSRMATYTQPTGFLAATFPTGTIANTTNITAGTITTTTNLTTNNDKTGYALTSADHIVGADALLDRNMATGTDSGSPTVRTVRQSLRFLRNKWAISGTTLTVNKEDDTTASWTATVATDAAAIPVVGSDPA